MTGEKRKLIKFSNYSLCVTLPKTILTKMNWKKGDIVQMFVDEKNKSIIISKNKLIKFPKRTIAENNNKSQSNKTARW